MVPNAPWSGPVRRVDIPIIMQENESRGSNLSQAFIGHCRSRCSLQESRSEPRAGVSRKPDPDVSGPGLLKTALPCAAIWVAYAAGAILGSFTLSYWRLNALFLPLAGIGVAIAADLIRPVHAPGQGPRPFTMVD